MKVKRLTIFLLIFVLLCWGHLSESVRALSLSDLSPFGIDPMEVAKGRSAIVDGIISGSEYGLSTVYRGEKGIYFLNNGHYQKRTSSGVIQENFVLISGDCVYCALKLNLPLDCGTISPLIRNGEACYRVSFSLGMSSGDHPVDKGSLLSNTYYFAADNFSCIGFTGERVARSTNESFVISKPLSSFSASYRDNGIVASDGSKWNAEFYCKNAAFSLQNTENGTILVAEVKVPLEDVLLSVLPAYRDSVKASLNQPSSNLCGNFSSAVDLNQNASIVCGVPSELAAPDSSGVTLFNWMKNNFETPVSGVYIPTVVPIPLYWTGYAPQKTVSDVSSEKTPIVTSVPATTVVVTTASNAIFNDPFESIPDTSTTPMDSDTKNDESIFDALPDRDSLLPEETEIIYDENFSSSKKNSDGGSLASTILVTVTGVLLFASVMVLCIYFRDSGKEDEKTQTAKKQGKKKNNKKRGKKDEGRDKK